MYTNIHLFLLNENIQQAKTILKNLELDPTKEQNFKDITKSLERLPNLIGKFVDFQYNQKAPKEDVKRVMTWVINNRESLNKLPKNILQYDTLEHLDDDIEDLKRKQTGNKFYKSLYNSMRVQVDKLDVDKRKEFDDLSLAFMKLPEAKQKHFTPLKYFERNNIGINDFMKALHSFLDKSVVNQDEEAILDKIEKYGDKVQILYNMNNVLVIETEDNKAVCDLGSQSWCIVYGSDYTRTNYFGPETYNTQLIVFNFNVPSTSSDSMFGITIYPDGSVRSGACQNKTNQYTPIERVIELTGVPVSVFKPNELKVIMKEFQTTLKQITKDVKNEIQDTNIDLFKIVEDIRKKITDHAKGNEKLIEGIPRIITDTMKQFDSEFYLTTKLIKSTFDGKSPKEMMESVSKNTDVKDILSNNILRHLQVLCSALNFENKESSQFFLTYYLSLNNSNNSLYDDFEKWYMDFINKTTNLSQLPKPVKSLDNAKYKIEDIDKYFSMVNIPNLVKDRSKELLLTIYEKVDLDLANWILSHPRKAESFADYKKVYNGVEWKPDGEDYHYQFFLEEGWYGDAALEFIDDEEFQDLVVELHERPNGLNIIDEICQESKYDYTYDILNKHDKELTALYDRTKSSPPDDDCILGLMMYLNSENDEYKTKFKKQMEIMSSGTGSSYVEYVEVSDFTSFDELIFKDEYFNQIEDVYWDSEKFDDYTMRNHFDYLDNYNIIFIASEIIDNNEGSEDLKDFPITTVKKYIGEDGRVNSLLMDKYEQDDEMKQLYNALEKLVFADEFEDSDMEYYIDDDIKKDILSRAMNNATESDYHDRLWKKLLNTIEEAMGGGYWPVDENDLPRTGKEQIYKFGKSEPGKGSKLYFTIDIASMMDGIDSYSDLYYVTDKKFNWADLLQYKYKTQESGIRVDLDNIYPDITKYYLNDSIRNL